MMSPPSLATRHGAIMAQPLVGSIVIIDGTGIQRVSAPTVSASGQKPTYALQNLMSALLPIATAKADSRKRPCPLHPRKQTCAAHLAHVCFVPIADIAIRSPRLHW